MHYPSSKFPGWEELLIGFYLHYSQLMQMVKSHGFISPSLMQNKTFCASTPEPFIGFQMVLPANTPFL